MNNTTPLITTANRPDTESSWSWPSLDGMVMTGCWSTEGAGERMRRMGELEAAVMAAIWRHDAPATVHAVLADLDRDPPPAYTTVITVIERLRAKGWLRRERAGRSFQYVAVRSASSYTAELMGDVLDSSADRGAALQRFAGRLTPDEIKDLRAALDDRTQSAPE